MRECLIVRVVATVCMLGCVLPHSALAVQPADRSQIKDRAQKSMQVWDAPAANYSTICSLFIRPSTMPREEALERLRGAMNSATSHYDRAALNYLIGEAQYYGSIASFLESRDRQELKTVGDQVAESFLTAWSEMCQAETNEPSKQLRHTIVSRYNELLETSLCGGGLSSVRKQQVVVQYIGQLGADDKVVEVWPLPNQNKVYSNLNMRCRSFADVVEGQPESYTNVVKALRIAMSVNETNEAVRLAALLQDKYGSVLSNSLDRSVVTEAYRRARDPRALERLREIALNSPVHWLDVYEIAIANDTNTSQAARNEMLVKYLDFETLETADQKRRLLVAMGRLEKAGDNNTVIALADRFLCRKNDANRADARISKLWRLKAKAHVKNKEWALARAAYAECAGWLSNENESLRKKCQKEVAEVERLSMEVVDK